MLPTVRIGDADVTRLIIGGNPFSGHSHVDKAMNDEMEDYFTTENVKLTLRRCFEMGINTMQLRADKHIMRIIREFRAEGGDMHWIAQTASELHPFESNINQIKAYKPAAIYHHGTVTDRLFEEGEIAELRRRLEVMRATGLPVGLGTHIPAIIERAESDNWGIDFYMACVFNLTHSGRLPNGYENFDEADPPKMYAVIKKLEKPCLAFKILASTRRCETQENVRAAFFEAYSNIKPTDAVVVGMFPKYMDQAALNAGYAREAILAAK